MTEELERASLKFAKRYSDALVREAQGSLSLPFLLYLAERWRKGYIRKFVGKDD